MRKIITILIILLIMISCNNEHEIKKDKTKIDNNEVLINLDSNGNRKSQYLVFASDTIHTILYQNGKIIYNEGEYVFVDLKIIDSKEKEVEFNLYSVDIDTLKKVFSLYETFDGYNYDTVAVKLIDSTFFTYTHQFKDSVADIIVKVLFGGKGDKVLFPRTFHPVIINFKKSTVDIKPNPPHVKNN